MPLPPKSKDNPPNSLEHEGRDAKLLWRRRWIRCRVRRRRLEVLVLVVLEEPVLERETGLALKRLVRIRHRQSHQSRQIRRLEGEALLQSRYGQWILLVLGLRLAQQQPRLGVVGRLFDRRLEAKHGTGQIAALQPPLALLQGVRQIGHGIVVAERVLLERVVEALVLADPGMARRDIVTRGYLVPLALETLPKRRLVRLCVWVFFFC